jgi:phage terminase large subunit-like protein
MTDAANWTIASLLEMPDASAGVSQPPDDRAKGGVEIRLERWARPEQLEPPGDWSTWLILAGRGFGKTRAGAEWTIAKTETCGRIAIVGETAADARDVMVEGSSGILRISALWNRPIYNSSKRELSWRNGAIAKTYSGEDPDQLRGPRTSS